MRNVNVDKPTDKPVDGTGFILTMRNVNSLARYLLWLPATVLY